MKSLELLNCTYELTYTTSFPIEQLFLVFDDTVVMDVGFKSGHRICGQFISIGLSWLLFVVGLLLLLLMVHVMVLY